MANREIERQHAQARRIRRQARSVGRGWPMFYLGLALLVIGLAITGVSYAFSRGGVFFVVLPIGGVILMVRGLANVPAQRRLEALQAPQSEREPWLFFQAPFQPDGSVPAPGWQTDPAGAARWWDGQNWTADTRT